MATRILVVDDEEAIREIVTSMLVAAGYECHQAGSGQEALEVLDSGEQFDLIATDIMMANLDGFALLERVKVEYPEIPVVFLTSVHEVSLAVAAFRAGVSDYLREPFERSQLLTTIRRALDIHRQRTETGTDKTPLESLVDARTTELRGKLAKLDFLQEGALVDALRLSDEGDSSYFDSRLVRCTVAIAGTLGLPGAQIKTIATGASIHHLGQVPALCNVLCNPEILLPDELALMCRLSNDIHEMLRSVPFLADSAEIVHAYPECFDGNGFPERRKGLEIPLGARILSVALFAIAHRSEWPRPRPLSSIRAEIEQLSGQRFDPEIVKIVLSIPDATWEYLGQNVSPN